MTAVSVIGQAGAAAVRAAQRCDQVIGWEVGSGRTTEAGAAAQLGVQSRTRVRAARARAETLGPLPRVPLPVVVFVRAGGQRQDYWEALQEACDAWGLVMVRDRTQAWHLGRGGCPVWLLDVSRDAHGGEHYMWGQVRARVGEDDPLEMPAVGQLTRQPRDNQPAAMIARIAHDALPQAR